MDLDARPDAAVKVTPIAPASAHGVRVRIAPAGAPVPPERTEAEWRRLVAANPRLHDGPILSVTEACPEEGLVVARREGYRNLAVRPRVDTGVVLLAVTAVLLALDAAGREHVLLGRRGRGTAVYPGLWELGPSGGVDPPPEPREGLGHVELLAQLRREIAEETGCSPELRGARAAALLHDPAAFSLDIVFVLSLREPVEALTPRATWEYPDARWVRTGDVAAFLAGEPAIPPTRALAAFLGW